MGGQAGNTATLLTSTSRTARCGPACRVVWQGRRGKPPPYADYGMHEKQLEVEVLFTSRWREVIAKRTGVARDAGSEGSVDKYASRSTRTGYEARSALKKRQASTAGIVCAERRIVQEG
jgi:hypothetical protein